VTSIAAADLEPYRTVVVDTAGRALDVLTGAIIQDNPKHGRGGALTLQGFGELKARFIAWTRMVRGFGLDVVLLCHSNEERSGDEVIERLDVQGGSKNEIYKSADVMGRIYLAGGKRTLNFSPTDTAFGKNPAQLPPLEVPNFAIDPQFLAGVLARIKADLNRQSSEQKAAADELADWKEVIDKAETVDHFNLLVPDVKSAGVAIRDNVKRLLNRAAKARGFEFDAKAGVYAAKAKAAA
jgi:hypothetical protein